MYVRWLHRDITVLINCNGGENIAQLLGLNTRQTIFAFVIDDTIQSIQVNTYRLADGEWKLESGGGGQAFSNTEGGLKCSKEICVDNIG